MRRRHIFFFHGWTDKWDFHEYVNWQEPGVAVFIRCRSLIGAWRKRHVNYVVDTVTSYDTDQVVFAGNSSGAAWIHWYAIKAREAGVNVTDIIHYGGLWRGHVCPEVNPIFLIGVDDHVGRWMPKNPRQGTYEGAKAYNTRVIEVPGGHRWNSEVNPAISEWLTTPQ